MNILLVSEYFPDSGNSEITGGVESRCLNVAKRLSAKNNVTVLTSWREGLKRKDRFGKIKVIRSGSHHKYSNYSGFISRFRFAIAASKEWRNLKDTDIVDGYNFTTYLPAFFIAKKLNIPCIATYHETWVGEWIKNKGVITGPPYELFERIILRQRFDRYISVSGFTKKRLVSRGVDENIIVVVPNGVEMPKNTISKPNKKKKTVIFVGRLVETKKVDLLLRAMVIVRQKIPGADCIVAGQGPELHKLKQLAADLGIGRHVEFCGFLKSHADVIKQIGSSSVFCSPSILEGFGITLLEAMSLGVPYVCSDIEPYIETTENGKGGLLFRKGDARDLAEKLIILLSDKKRYEKKVSEEKDLIKKYQWDQISDRIEEVYKKAIAGRK